MRHVYSAAASLCLFCLIAISAPQARADTVVLTGGSVQVGTLNQNQFGGAFVAIGAGDIFRLNYSGVTGGTAITPTSAGFGMFESGNQVCYLGACTTFLGGNITFTPSSLTGQVTGLEPSPTGGFRILFTVDFTATGVGTFDARSFPQPSAAAFVVSAPVPEPATLVLLVTGLVGVVGAARRRRRKS